MDSKFDDRRKPKRFFDAEPAMEVQMQSMYRVQPGDTLEKIAEALLQQGVVTPKEEIVAELLRRNRTLQDTVSTEAVVLSRELLYIPRFPTRPSEPGEEKPGT